MGVTELRARFFAPPDELAGCFTSFYLLEVELADGDRVVDHLHPEWANLRFFFGSTPETFRADGSMLAGTPFTATGPSSRPTRFSVTTARMWGIGLLPLGWARFMDVPASTMANSAHDGLLHPAFAKFVPLYEALRDSGGDDEAQADIIGQFFLDRNRAVRGSAKIAAINDALVDAGVHNASELATRANITQRTLERVCSRYFGFSPRRLIRRQRMMRTLSAFMLAEKSSWSRVIDLHYTDHAHFTHDFHAIMEMSPSDYAALDHPILAAFMAERARVMGSPVQTMDRPGLSKGAQALR